MSVLTGLGMLLLEVVRTLVIDTVIKVILHPEECVTSTIKLGGPLLEN